MNTPRKVSAFAALGLSLALGVTSAQAQEQATKSTAFGNWQVTEMRAGGAEMDLPYCAMSNYFSNDVLLVMSKSSDGSGSIALDFNSNRLSLEKEYPVTIDISNRAQYSYSAYPGNRQALVLELEKADDLFLPMAKYPEITVSLANTNMNFNLGPFVSGLNDLNGCLSALTGQQVAAVDLSKVTVGNEAPGTPAPAITPMGGVAQAMWKTDPEAAPEPAPTHATTTVPAGRKLPEPSITQAKPMPVPVQEPELQTPSLTVVSSNASAQGVDLKSIYATGTAPSMQATAVAPSAQPVPLAAEQTVVEQAVYEQDVSDQAVTTPAVIEEQPQPAAATGEVRESVKFSTNRKDKAAPQSVVITAADQKPMNPSMDGQARQIQTDYEAMRTQQTGQPITVADLGDGSGQAQAEYQPQAHAQGRGLDVASPLDSGTYNEMREKYRSPVYDRRGVNVPLAQAIEQISPRGFTVHVMQGVNAQTPVSWNGGRPWRVLLDAMLEPLGYSAIVTENQITLAAKKN